METHKIHTKTGKITPCLRVHYVVIDMGLTVIDINPSRLNKMWSSIDVCRHMQIISIAPVTPPRFKLELREYIIKSLLVVLPQHSNVCPKDVYTQSYQQQTEGQQQQHDH